VTGRRLGASGPLVPASQPASHGNLAPVFVHECVAECVCRAERLGGEPKGELGRLWKEFPLGRAGTREANIDALVSPADASLSHTVLPATVVHEKGENGAQRKGFGSERGLLRAPF